MIRRLICAAALTAAIAQPALSAETPDSLERATAVFISSNFKLGVEQALRELSSRGLDVDSATVMRLVAQELATPYSRQAHDAAYEYVSAAMAASQKAASEAFLAEAAAKPGARILPSGLIIETVAEGSGESPSADDNVSFRYRGTLPGGIEFDAIAPEEQPMVAKPSNLVPGMTEGLQHMKPGGRYILTIPPELGYGASGAGGSIPPDTPLRFEIEFIEITN